MEDTMPRKSGGAAAVVAGHSGVSSAAPAGATGNTTTGPNTDPGAPGFCSSCGLALVDESRPVFAGFDPVTGVKLPDRIVTRRKCPTGGHDRYVKTDEGWERTF